MAFVSESPRKPIAMQNQSLGPGYYSWELAKNQLRLSCAPFQSTSLRKLNEEALKHAVPAPGSYDIFEPNPKRLMILEEQASTKVYNLTKLQSFFLSRVSRFKQSATEVPGPGAQQFREQLSSLSQTHQHTRSSSRLSRPKQILSKIIQETREKIPTIPGPNRKFGYTENQHKKLLPITRTNEKVVPRDGTVDSAHHNSTFSRGQKQEKSDIIMKVKHVIQKHRDEGELAGTAQSKRSLKAAEEGKPAKESGTASFKNSVSRLNMAPLLEVPGPGSYNPPTVLKPKQTKQKFQFFGSTSLRFCDKENLNQLNSQQHLKFNLVRQSPIKAKQNFSKEKRSIFVQSSDGTPGPGAYDDVPCSPLLKKAAAVIVGTEERFKAQSINFPAPGAYEPDTVVETRKKNFVTKKRTLPFPKLTPKVENDKLEVCTNEEGTQKIIKPCFPNYFYSEKPIIPFGSLQQRFSYEEVVTEADSQQEKSKQQYSIINRSALKSVKQNQPSSFISSSPRFVNEASTIENSSSLPGPGFYNTNEISSLLKPSYNVKFRS